MDSYLAPTCRLSLRDAIAQLRQSNGNSHDVAPSLAKHLQRALTAHDAVHAIFACDTSDRGEAMAHIWMIVGTTVTFRELREVVSAGDHKKVVAGIGRHRRFLAVIRALPHMLGVLFRARRMTRRWPWLGYDAYIDVPISEIRKKYGIVVTAKREASWVDRDA